MVDERATSFGAAAGSYEAGRPDYPFDAVAWMLERLPAGAHRVADVGAGTGKLTRRLVAAPDAQVVAVDPDPAMLTALRASTPGVPTFIGTAEQLPLPDASVDAVVMGQAWHWVDPIAASMEIGRVVRPGGTLGLIWNVRDGRVPWVRRLTGIMNASVAEEMVAGPGPQVAAPFDALEEERWEWSRPMSREQLHHMALSRSHLIALGDEERAAVLSAMDDLFDAQGLSGDGTLDVPYVTVAYRSVHDG